MALGAPSQRTISFGDSGESRLPPTALRYLNLVDVISTSATALVVIAAAIAFLPPEWRVAAVIAIIVASLVGVGVELPLLNRLRVRHTSYTVTSEIVYLARGVLIRRIVTLPAAHVLNVEIVQGPILRRCDLVTIRFVTITAIEPLGPLTPDAARVIRASILGSTIGVEHD